MACSGSPATMHANVQHLWVDGPGGRLPALLAGEAHPAGPPGVSGGDLQSKYSEGVGIKINPLPLLDWGLPVREFYVRWLALYKP